MTAANTPRPRRLAGHRPSALSSAGRPRKVADSRRVAVRSASGTVEAQPAGPVSGSPPPLAGASASEVPPQASDVTRQTRPRTDAAGDSAGAGAARDTSRPRAGRLTVVLLAVALLLAVVVGLLARNLLRLDDRADAREAAQVVAADSMETILSYEYSKYDKGVAEAKTLMTDGFARKYARTVSDVRSTVLHTRSVVKADVVAASVISAEPDRVKALLFVNQTTTGKQVQQPRVDLNRVVGTLVRDGDGAWLVSDIDAL